MNYASILLKAYVLLDA